MSSATATEARTALATTYAEQADAGASSSHKAFRDIPRYEDASPEMRAKLDERIAAFDKLDPEAGITFGDAGLAERNRIAEEILAAQEGDRFGFLKNPLQEAVGFMKGIDIEGLSAKVNEMLSKGAGVVKRNPLLTAGALGLSLVSLPVGLVAGGTAIALKEKARAFRERNEPESVEDLEAKLSESISGFKPLVRNLEFARSQIPEMRRSINMLGRANIAALESLTLDIAAGREIIRQLEAEDVPGALEEGNFDDHATYSLNAANLRMKLPILEQARNTAIMDVTVLANLVQSVTNIDLSLYSILSHEAPNHRSSLAAQGLALDVLRTGKLVDEFRQKTGQGMTQAIAATGRAREIAASGRVDSPERMKATLENLNRVKALLEAQAKALPGAQKQQALLQGAVETAAKGVIDAQVAAAANNNTPLLGGAPGSTPMLELLNRKPM